MEISTDIETLNQQIYIESAFVEKLEAECRKVIVGQSQMLERLLIGLLTKGHILLEGLPGLAKTLSIKTLSQAINAHFSRIQFTPDLLPSDIIGTLIYNPNQAAFSVRKGPIFANFILADEINRAPAKVQAALLEAMQERQVTIGDETYKLEEPFLVMATQNPIDQEGTYPLPEAQVDRFMLKVKVDYPSMDEEKQILKMHLAKTELETINAVLEPAAILKARQTVQKVYVDDKIEQYILDIVFATRTQEDGDLAQLKDLIDYGASPRATINLAQAAKAKAFLNRRGFVIPDDVRNICMDVLRHRIGLSYEAEAENVSAEDIVRQILSKVQVP